MRLRALRVDERADLADLDDLAPLIARGEHLERRRVGLAIVLLDPREPYHRGEPEIGVVRTLRELREAVPRLRSLRVEPRRCFQRGSGARGVLRRSRRARVEQPKLVSVATRVEEAA